jgi:hypothetical protein
MKGQSMMRSCVAWVLLTWGMAGTLISGTIQNAPDLIAYDGFTDYVPAPLGGTNGNGGVGWTNAWTTNIYSRVVTPTRPLAYVNGNIAVLGGSRAMCWPGAGPFFDWSAPAVQTAARGIPKQQRDLYFSCLCAYTNGTIGAAHLFALTTMPYLDIPGGNRQSGVFFGRLDGTAELGGTAHNDDCWQPGSRIGSEFPTINQTYLMVGKMTWSSVSNGFVQTDGWINPDNRFAPSGFHGVSRAPVVSIGGFTSVYLQAMCLGPLGHPDSIHMLMDEVRIGPTWQSVFPVDALGTVMRLK